MADKVQPKPYVPDEARVAEFTLKAVLFGGLFGLLFGASTVYLALRSGLTVSASIPIAVLAISLLKRLGGSTILENNLVQTIGSAGESIAGGVVFTLPGFLFLSSGAHGDSYFSYWTIFTLALLGGVLGILMMIPLRPALIVKEHEALPYPEGTACASVLIAGEKGGSLARIAYLGLAFGLVYGYRLFRATVSLVNGEAGTLEMQLRTMAKGHAVVVTSFAPYSAEAVRVAQAAKEQGCRLVAITDSAVIRPVPGFSSVGMF